VNTPQQAVAVPGEAALRFPWPSAPAPGEIQEIAEGILWLRMPLPLKLDHINLYLLRDRSGWVVVDTGINTPRAREVWERVFSEELHGEPVVAVVCTHFHYDHSGLVYWLCERFACPLYITQGEYQAMAITPPEDTGTAQEFFQFHRRAGLDEAASDAILASVQGGDFKMQRPDQYRRLREGALLHIGGRQWQVVIGAGHSPEHACLYCEADGVLLSGDQVLPRITSNVCVGVFEPDADPLRQWLDSIQRLRAIPDKVLVLPAHELPFYGLHPRLTQLQQHHERHLEVLMAAIKGQPPMTAAALRPVLFPAIKGDFDLLMALGETLAHLHFLLGQRRLVRTHDGGVYHFAAST